VCLQNRIDVNRRDENLRAMSRRDPAAAVFLEARGCYGTRISSAYTSWGGGISRRP
jgi:hypothetical protein